MVILGLSLAVYKETVSENVGPRATEDQKQLNLGEVVMCLENRFHCHAAVYLQVFQCHAPVYLQVFQCHAAVYL